MTMNRRTFSTTLLTVAAAPLISARDMAVNATPEKARNVVLVHGLFADGSSWSEVIPRLQAAGLAGRFPHREGQQEVSEHKGMGVRGVRL